MIRELDTIPKVEKAIEAIKQLSCGKAPDNDSIPPEIFKHGGDTVTEELTQLYEQIWTTAEVPGDFKGALIVHFYNNKGDQQICDNHHGISLLSTAGKILAKANKVASSSKLTKPSLKASVALDLVRERLI